MSTPDLTATFSLSIRIDPRDDLSLCLNKQVIVERTIEGYRASLIDTATQSALPTAGYSSGEPYDDPETAMMAEIAMMLAHVETTLEDAIDGEVDHV